MLLAATIYVPANDLTQVIDANGRLAINCSRKVENIVSIGCHN